MPVARDKLRLITASYDLAQAENRVMIEWLLSDRKYDIRFRLRSLLWSNAVVDSYSAIIIDCPPRFTTGAIQAFAAATHFLIPTKLDSTSSSAVVTFLDQLELLREENICWENAKHLGVVATMVNPSANNDRRQFNDKLASRTKYLAASMDIHENVVFRNASSRGIAYFGMGEGMQTERVKTSIKTLAHYIARQMSLPLGLQEDPAHEIRRTETVADEAG